MKNLKTLFGIAALTGMTLVACQRHGEKSLTPQQWNPSKGPLPKNLEKEVKTFKSEDVQAEVQGQKVYRKNLKVNDLPVLNAELSAIKNKNGEWAQVSAQLPPRLNVREKLLSMYLKKNTDKFMEKFERDVQPKEILEKQVVLATLDPLVDGELKPYLEIKFIEAYNKGIERVLIDSQENIVDRQTVSFHLVEGKARVYSGTPEDSDLAFMKLRDMSDNGYLESPKLKLQSVSSERVQSKNHVFDLSPEDPNFDQVQAYYFADRATDWYKSQLGIELRGSLEIEVHVGAPDKTNAAFYYNRKIRLGEGDGITYQKLCQDPTVVTHEVSHAFVEKLSGLKPQGESGSLSEAFCDYFTSQITKTPRMAEYAYIPDPYRRTIENEMTKADLNGGLYNDSLVVSGTLWEIRQALDQKKTNELVVKTLMLLGPYAKLADFPEKLKEVGGELLSAEDQAKLISIADKRWQ
ncbi:MAG: hypothetical protein KDD22_04775 [Bdellovibrionales bacterium]|nr:hypothetical protein [Bdellovibrionales bacterium]